MYLIYFVKKKIHFEKKFENSYGGVLFLQILQEFNFIDGNTTPWKEIFNVFHQARFYGICDVLTFFQYKYSYKFINTNF